MSNLCNRHTPFMDMANYITTAFRRTKLQGELVGHVSDVTYDRAGGSQ
jgi:hypothetical protein